MPNSGQTGRHAHWFVVASAGSIPNVELLLVGLLALLGQVPWWVWLVTSAVLFAALWVYDHRVELQARFHCLAPQQRTALGWAAAVTAVILSVAVTWSIASNRHAGQVPKAVPVTLEQALITVIAVVTEQTHDPLRVTFHVINAGKLPTTAVFWGVEHKIVDAPVLLTSLRSDFAKGLALAKKNLAHDTTTIVPRQSFKFTLHTPLVTKDEFEEVKAGKKAVYILFAVTYRDASTPPGKHIVTEMAVRSSPFTHAAATLRDWSIVANRSYISD